MRESDVIHLLAGVVALVFAQAALGQERPSQAALGEAAPAEEESERVVVTGKPSREMIYDFYQDLSRNDFCPRWTYQRRGHSCAEITYDVFDASGKHLGQCNIPIFRLYGKSNFEYTAVTFEEFDCTGKDASRKGDLTYVGLAQILNPKTSDGTVLKKVSVLGLGQAVKLCEVSSALCVVSLFDRTEQLSSRALCRFWDVLLVPADSARCR